MTKFDIEVETQRALRYISNLENVHLVAVAHRPAMNGFVTTGYESQYQLRGLCGGATVDVTFTVRGRGTEPLEPEEPIGGVL